MVGPCLDIIVASGDLEAYAIRAVVECFGYLTRLYPVGKPSDLVGILSGKQALAENILISCHGRNGRILLDEIAPKIAARERYHNSIGASEVREFTELNGQTVLCTGCDTGRRSLAQAFLSCGAGTFIAPSGCPLGSEAVMFAVEFYFCRGVRKLDEERAWRDTMIFDSRFNLFKRFSTL
jgi:hypothetical protein